MTDNKTIESLDPRVTRLGISESWDGSLEPKAPMDQFETYEVFVKPKESKPFEHAGIVHAPNEEMGFLFAKEQYTRRGFTCFGLFVVPTSSIQVAPMIDGDTNLYDLIDEDAEVDRSGEKTSYELFHLKKRGKQHVYAGTVEAHGFEDAIMEGKKNFHDGKPLVNLWVIRTEDLFVPEDAELDLWSTLHEKKYREPIDYKAADKIKKFKEEQAAG
ncbi:phenylacetic acid degradation b [Roseivirga sp. BDSF3-8]|uniref:phenylacetic acid degradation b n=1 Tax=Roseivirga sp. BDSF3-8 TaxID=3241598 RepID=UPI0035322929